MILKLTSEQSAAILDQGGLIQVEDENTRRLYVIIEQPAFASLQQQSDLEAIRRGTADALAGRVSSLNDAYARIRAKLSSSKPT